MMFFVDLIFTVISTIFVIGLAILFFLWLIGLIYNVLYNIYDVVRISLEGIANDED